MGSFTSAGRLPARALRAAKEFPAELSASIAEEPRGRQRRTQRLWDVGLGAAVGWPHLDDRLRGLVIPWIRRHLADADPLVAGTVARIWPGLAESRAHLSRGFPKAAPVHVDGSPQNGDTIEVWGWLERVMLFARLASREGSPLPVDFLGRAAAAGRCLYLRAPPRRLGPALFEPSQLAVAASNACAAQGWGGSAAPIVGADELSNYFGGVPRGEAFAPTPAQGWACWAFRSGDLAVFHGRHRDRAARVVLDGRSAAAAPAAALQIDVDDIPLISPGGAIDVVGLSTWFGRPRGKLSAARVDGRVARATVRPTTWVGVRRNLILKPGRATVEDTPPRGPGKMKLYWPIPASWRLSHEDWGFSVKHPSGLSGRLRLDGKLSWRVEREMAGEAVIGHGKRGPVTTIIEWW